MAETRALFLVLAVVHCAFTSVMAQEKPRHVAIQVRETAGIRRFGYPVTAQVLLPQGGLRDPRHARLVNADGKPLPAQITATAKHADGSLQRIDVDLNLSPGPLETTKLKLEYGDGVTSVEPKQGLSFTETAETYQVSAYTIRKDAQPLISSIRYGREYLKPGGLGVAAWSGGAEHSLQAAKRTWTVEKQGPFQVRLRCEGVYAGQGSAAELPFTLTLEFVSTKSWVGLRHSLHPATATDQPVALGIVGDFQLAGRLLWDTDVDYWLYGVLESAEQVTFSQSADAWLCQLGKVDQQTPYAASTSPHRRCRGWGHFQEARENGNVIAFGFGGLAVKGDYSYSLGGDGKMQLRCNSTGMNPSQLNAFFHFIPVPAQHTARTSPAAMMSPLEVTHSIE